MKYFSAVISLQLSFFDNGTLDGDTISMVLNGRIIAEKIKLTTQCFQDNNSFKDRSKRFTGVGHACRKPGADSSQHRFINHPGRRTRYEIRFEGDLLRSSAIVLKRKR
jgi:hypothetical protein